MYPAADRLARIRSEVPSIFMRRALFITNGTQRSVLELAAILDKAGISSEEL